jgi:hypothetical protein
LLLAASPLAYALCSVVCELVCLSLRLDPDRRPSLLENVLEVELELLLDNLELPFRFCVSVFVFLRRDDSTSSSKVTFRFLTPFFVDFGLGVGLKLGTLGIEFSKLGKSTGLSSTNSHSEPASVFVGLSAFLSGLGLPPFFDLSNPIFK